MTGRAAVCEPALRAVLPIDDLAVRLIDCRGGRTDQGIGIGKRGSGLLAGIKRQAVRDRRRERRLERRKVGVKRKNKANNPNGLRVLLGLCADMSISSGFRGRWGAGAENGFAAAVFLYAPGFACDSVFIAGF